MNERPTYPNPWHPDDEARWSPVTKSWVFTKKYETPPQLEKFLHAGKLSQICTHCQHVEPAGAYCSKCGRQINPEKSWFKPSSLGEDGKPRRGRPKAVDVSKMVGVLNNANA